MTVQSRLAAATAAFVLVSCVGLLASPVTIGATMDVKDAIEARQKAMKENAEHMKAINAYLETGQGDPAMVAEHASAIAEIAKAIPTVFPAGSSLADGHGIKTAAKPEIWTDRAGFEQAAIHMGEEAQELVEVAAGGDKQAIAAAFAELGKEGCGGCHSKFRQKQD